MSGRETVLLMSSGNRVFVQEPAEQVTREFCGESNWVNLTTPGGEIVHVRMAHIIAAETNGSGRAIQALEPKS